MHFSTTADTPLLTACFHHQILPEHDIQLMIFSFCFDSNITRCMLFPAGLGLQILQQLAGINTVMVGTPHGSCLVCVLFRAL